MSADAAAGSTGRSRVVLQAEAPAKVNLVLAVGPVRDDGFHPLVSVLQCIDLCDRLVLDLEPGPARSGVDVVTRSVGIEVGDTLVRRAIEQFAAQAGVGVRARVTIEKRIPVGAGLGGGSSDAAAALRAMSLATGHPLDAVALSALAAGLGSDVPSFLVASGRSAVTGRGEHVVELPADPAMPDLLVAWAGDHASTPDVYRCFDELPPPRGGADLPTVDAAIADAAGADGSRWHDDLAEAAVATSPPLRRLLDAAAQAGARPLVSGSGSAMFLPVLEGLEVDRVTDALAAAGATLVERVSAARSRQPVVVG